MNRTQDDFDIDYKESMIQEFLQTVMDLNPNRLKENPDFWYDIEDALDKAAGRA